MKKIEVEGLAKETFGQFPYRIKRPAVLFLNKRQFSKYLSDMALEKHPDKTPCFVAHLPAGDCICFYLGVVNRFVKGKPASYARLFIHAVVLHELYHIYNRHCFETAKEALKSEEGVHREIEKDFPEIAQMLDELEGAVK